MKFFSPITLLLSILFLVLGVGTSRIEANENPTFAVWSEFLPYTEVSADLPELCRTKTGLFLAIHDGDWKQAGFQELWQGATACGIELRAWILLEAKDGYWANKWNLPQMRDTLTRFLTYMDQNRLLVQWITLDLEPSPDLQSSLSVALSERHLSDATEILRKSAASASLLSAQREMHDIVDEMHSRSIRVHAVTMPFVLDDSEGAGNEKIQNALGIPLGNVNWDEISVMLYRPEFEKMIGSTGPRVVYDYAKRAHDRWGDRVSIDLGEVGTVGYPFAVKGFQDPAELQKDVSAVLATGINRIHIYSLDGMAQLRGLQSWIRPSEPHIPFPSFRSAFLNALIRFLRISLPDPDTGSLRFSG